MGDIGYLLARHPQAGSSLLGEILKSLGDYRRCRDAHFLNRDGVADDRRRAAASMADAYDHSMALRLYFRP